MQAINVDEAVIAGGLPARDDRAMMVLCVPPSGHRLLMSAELNHKTKPIILSSSLAK